MARPRGDDEISGDGCGASGHSHCSRSRALRHLFLRNVGSAAVGVAVLVAASAITRPLLAQDESEAPAPGSLNAAQGPITGSPRFIGLGGAFVALAEDSEGVALNPASDAVRLPYSWSQLDYGFGIDFAIGAWLPKNDFYNQPSDGNVDQSTALFGSVHANVYYQHFGLGLAAEAQSNATSRPDKQQGVTSSLGANFGVVHASVAYGFGDGQLLVGAGPRIIGMSFDSGASSNALSSAGIGYEAGVIFKPIVGQYRLGVAVKSAIDATLPGGAAEPDKLHVPWEVAVGVAYQFGARPLNPPFVTAKKYAASGLPANVDPTKAQIQKAEDELFERYQRLSHRYLLVSAELKLVERTAGGGFQGYWDENAKTSSASDPLLSPRLGLESEVIKHHLRLRAGSYYEPPLAVGATGRVHGTGGFDVRLFRWDVFGLLDRFDYWQLSVAGDGARSYLNTAFSIGFWH
jgi:hypothetical protein